MAVGRTERVAEEDFTILSESDMQNLYIILSKKVDETLSCQIDMIVDIARGGKVPGRMLSDLLGINEMQTIGYVSYGEDLAPGELLLTQNVEPGSVKGKKVLLVDEIVDKAKTVIAAAKELMGQGALSVHIAAVAI